MNILIDQYRLCVWINLHIKIVRFLAFFIAIFPTLYIINIFSASILLSHFSQVVKIGFFLSSFFWEL